MASQQQQANQRPDLNNIRTSIGQPHHVSPLTNQRCANSSPSDAKLEHFWQVAIALESVNYSKTDESGLQRLQRLQPKRSQSGGV